VRAEREAYLALVSALEPEDLVFVDEMGSHVALTRLYARSPRGRRAYGTVKRNRGRNLTTIGAITLEGVQASFAFEGGTDGPAFLVFVRRVLVPTLRRGQVVILDNLGAHQVEGVREAIEAVGCHLVFLPGYSPDLNPIEECWSKVKAYLRKLGARSRETLEAAIGEALALVRPSDLRGWFAHAGYRV
jgi:transposase